MCAWTTPLTWDVSKALSVARLNEQLRDNLQYLYDNWPASGWGQNFVRNGHFDGWLAGTSAAPDTWTLAGAGAAVAREAATFKIGTYSAKLTNGAATAASLSHSLLADMVIQLRGQTITLGAWVYAGAASRAFIRVTDGTTTTDSGYHTGAAGWEFLTVTLGAVVNAAAAAITVSLQVSAGDAISVYVDGVILTAGPLASLFVNGFNDWSARLRRYQNSSGTNFLLGGGQLMQIGLSGGASGNITVTFPAAFSATPYTVMAIGSGGANTYWISALSNSAFTATRVGSASAGVFWIAIGPE